MQRFERNRLTEMQERTVTQTGLRHHFNIEYNYQG
jgi:hypothetical protein